MSRYVFSLVSHRHKHSDNRSQHYRDPDPALTVCLRESVNASIMPDLPANSIITTMIGTAITPLINADQNNALIGSIGVKLSSMPPMVASEMIA